jgi:hypothetical protein
VGFAALGLGLGAAALTGDTVPQPIAGQRWTRLPWAGVFGGQVAIYGHPSAERAPSAAQLGCTLATAGLPASGAVSRDGVGDLDRVVLDGTALDPLLRVVGSADAVRCTGSAAGSSGPLFAVVQRGVDDMVPMAAYSLTSLALVLGVAGVLLLRPTDR